MVDATVGMGGHSESILEQCSGARVVGIDRDREALSLAQDRLARFGDRFTAVHAVYDDLAQILTEIFLKERTGEPATAPEPASPKPRRKPGPRPTRAALKSHASV